MATEDPVRPTASPTEDDDLNLNMLFAPAEYTICESGDIILLVDDGLSPAVKLRVSSVILAMVSPVFKAMFSDRYKEGQFVGTFPREIALHDNPKAMKWLCQMLHHQDVSDDEIRYGPYHDVLELAVTADKFNCVKAIRLQVEAILTLAIDATPHHIKPLADLMTTAFTMDIPQHFRQCSRLLVMNAPTLQPQALPTKCVDLLPPDLWRSLTAQQAAIRHEMSYQVSLLMQNFMNMAIKLETVTEFMTILRHARLVPLDHTNVQDSIESQLERFAALDPPILNGSETKCSCAGATIGYDLYTRDLSPYSRARRASRDSGWGSPRSEASYYTLKDHASRPSRPSQAKAGVRQIFNAAEKIKSLCVGICLDCIQGHDSCRVMHTEPWASRRDIQFAFSRDDIMTPPLGGDSIYKAEPSIWEDTW